MSERYVNFFTDFGFKRLFGSEPSKELLKDFLNELLKGEGETIAALSYKPTEQMPSFASGRGAVFDLYCENERGEKFIVELQKAKQDFFKDRSVFYATFPIREQAQRGDWDFRLKAVYTVGILDFVFAADAADREKFLYTVKLTDQDTKKVFYDKLTFVYLEMPKFVKQEKELETRMDKWLFAIRNLARLDRVPAALQESVFSRFFELAEVAKFTPVECEAYEESLKQYRDMHNVIVTARREGEDQGRAEGRAEGEAVGVVRGRAEGRAEGRVDALLKILGKRFAPLPPDVREVVGRVGDEAVLDAAMDVALEAKRLEEVLAVLNRKR